MPVSYTHLDVYKRQVLDRMVEQYLEKNANTVVINIACGLDTRCYRMKGKYLRWYNVDLPETMKIRSQFLTETDSVYQIAKSVMDDSYIDDIDYHGENVLVIIEGLTMYLCEKDIRLSLIHICVSADIQADA